MCMWCVAESYSQMNGQAGAGAWHESASSSASSGGSGGSAGSGGSVGSGGSGGSAGSVGSGGSGELLQLRRAAKVRAGGQISPHLCSYAEAHASRLGGLDLPGSVPGTGRSFAFQKIDNGGPNCTSSLVFYFRGRRARRPVGPIPI